MFQWVNSRITCSMVRWSHGSAVLWRATGTGHHNAPSVYGTLCTYSAFSISRTKVLKCARFGACLICSGSLFHNTTDLYTKLRFAPSSRHLTLYNFRVLLLLVRVCTSQIRVYLLIRYLGDKPCTILYASLRQWNFLLTSSGRRFNSECMTDTCSKWWHCNIFLIAQFCNFCSWYESCWDKQS